MSGYMTDPWYPHNLTSTQDVFVKKVLRSKEKVARRSAKTRRGWYTVEGMKNTLQWSKQLELNSMFIMSQHCIPLYCSIWLGIFTCWKPSCPS